MKKNDQRVTAERKPRYTLYMRAAIIVLSVWAAMATTVDAGEEAIIDGVVHITNGATPQNEPETMKLTELWRAGGDDEEILFGLVTDVLSDDEGTVYVLDTQLSEVQVFSPDGSHLRTLSRQGEGPGETNSPVDMLFMADGTVGLVQTFPGKIVKLQTDATPAGEMTFGSGDPTQGGFLRLVDAGQAAGNLVLGGERIVVNQEEGKRIGTNFLASFDENGEETVRYLEKDTVLEFANIQVVEEDQYFVHFRRWTMGNDGRVYAAADRDNYAINVYQSDGTLERIIEREFDHWTRDEMDNARIEAVMDAARRRSPIEINAEFCETEPDITTLHVDGSGQLWVQHSRSTRELPEGILVVYDVFDEAGHFVRQVSVECPGDPLNDGLIFAGDDRVIQITGFVDAFIALQGGGAVETDEEEEPEPMEIICYNVIP